VAAALLQAARRDAGLVRGQADEQAAAILADARREAAGALETARADGAAEAHAYGTAERAKARRGARTTALAARREALEGLRRETRRATGLLQDDRPLRERLVALAGEACGDGAIVTGHPDGGVVADAPGRHVDCSFGALADRAVDALGAEVEELWTP
jgi:vacuolar-type H+-ATPase subunit E/Vma4